MKWKIVTVLVLAVIAAAILYQMSKDRRDNEEIDTGDNPERPGNITPPNTPYIDSGPWSKFMYDKITDGPGATKAGATQMWINGLVYPLGDKIEGGVGKYSTKPDLTPDKPKIG